MHSYNHIVVFDDKLSAAVTCTIVIATVIARVDKWGNDFVRVQAKLQSR